MPSSKSVLLAAAAACILSTQAHAALVFSLADNGSSLIRFDTATPGAVTTVGSVAGATTRLNGLDFRPSNGLLYGYSDFTGSVYTVDSSTGVTTLVSTLSIPTNTVILGIDFNPVPDRLRIVTASDQNLRVNVASGATTMDTNLAYAPGDPNAGAAPNPNIVDAAYTNSSLGVASSTKLYYIDHFTNSLVTTTLPNAGVLNTVGALGVDIDIFSGFDIFSNAGANNAFAQFRVGGVNGLYSINLATGAATALGAIGNTSLMYGLAIVPGQLPEPGSLALLGSAGLATLVVRRRQPAKSAQLA